jgi:hypothetical protein
MSNEPKGQEPESQADGKQKPAKKAERYFKVRFHDKRHSTEQDSVELVVNGESLVVQRGIQVCIPERYVECAEHAQYPQFSQKPGEDRKCVGYLRVFPFDILGDGTREEFLALKRDGTKQLLDDMKAAEAAAIRAANGRSQ